MEWGGKAYLSAVVFTLYGQKPMMSSSHACQTIPDEIRFGVIIGSAQDVSDGDWIGCDESVTA